MIRASIVLRIKNEAKTLREVLKKVFEQDFSEPFEVIIVDSGSTDDSLRIAREFETRISEIKPEDFSWGYALNLGTEKAHGEFIVFLSGHSLPGDNVWLKTLLFPFEDAHVAGTYGRHMPYERVDPLEYVELIALFPEKKEDLKYISFSNASSAIRRSVWEKYKFNEELLSSEDGEWALRVQKAGYRIEYVPTSIVYHSHPPTVDNIYKRWFWRAYCGKHFFPGARRMSLPYIVFNYFRYLWRDTKYLLAKRNIKHLARIPFYELVRQWGNYKGGKATFQKPMKEIGWDDITIPELLKKIKWIVER